MFANMARSRIEVTETEQPIQILDYEFLPDTGRRARYRGGAPSAASTASSSRAAMLQVRADRRRFLPYGLQGGSAGAALDELAGPGTGRRSRCRPN